ncbi:MAG: ABC-F family ATP-binding cassette domain-containing protein [Desulfobacterales bacterium]|nr:ABC-F family ATP-binding cassette domain-containing protein [Desulfobacterales bacterium]MCP4159145.1 ABC-F family ATP-binding cassette domain-containing protein [Deltaproteobacteria bacterium]
MISFENISKGYGGQILFEDAGFKINNRERIGLVGRNGHGKTTLLKMIINEDEIDSGNILIPKNYRIGYVKQHLKFTEDTVLKEGILGLREEESDHHWKVEKILAGLGFSKTDMDKNPLDFSGGFQVRLNLAKVLANEPDLLLLDEPTNYLDITSVRWIQNFLLSWQNELILITHDRNFMDKVVTHVVGIHRKTIRKIPGDTEKFYSQIALDEEIYEKTRVNDEKKRKEIELFVTRFRAKARLANMVQSRVKTLSKMEKKDKLDALSDLEFSFRSSPFKGKQVLQAENINFGYVKDKPLIKDVDLTINPNDRVCVIGKNGKGKTTLLKILGGIIEPDTGSVILNPGVERGVYEQTNVKTLNDQNTVVDELCYTHPDVDNQQARNICGAMMFEGDSALKKVKVLSGGEKSRVMLGKLLVTPLNLILLDEPTNHLDMQSCDSLLAAIDNFEGSVVMVTHNEMYLHAIAKRLIVFKDDKVFMFNGTYAEFLEKEGWGDDKNESVKAINSDEKLSKKEYKKLRSEIIQRRSSALKPLNNGIEDAENKIENNEEELETLNEKLLIASEKQDVKVIQDCSKKIHDLTEEINILFDKLEELSDKQSKESEIYNKELEDLEKRS